MEPSLMVDVLLGALMLVVGFVLKRIFQLIDKLMEEAKTLHARIKDVSTEAVSRTELQGAIDRVLSRLEKMEERLMSK